MNKIIEKLNKLSLPAVILIASIILGGVFYITQVNKQRSIEKQQQIKIEQEKQDQLEKELKEQQVKEEAEQALSACIANEEERYHDNWYRECKAQGSLTSECIDIQELSFSDYLDKYNLNPTTYNQQRGLPIIDEIEGLMNNFLTGGYDYIERRINECSCSLLVSTSDKFDKILTDGKDECFKRYPQ